MSLSDGVAIANLVVAVVALVVAGVAMYIALRTMKDSEEDWKQRKWYKLYFAAGLAYDMLDQFRKVYSQQVQTLQKQDNWNELMMYVRQSHSMATVFPKNPAVDALFEATNFSSTSYAYDDARFKKLGDAVEALRQKALLNSGVLE